MTKKSQTALDQIVTKKRLTQNVTKKSQAALDQIVTKKRIFQAKAWSGYEGRTGSSPRVVDDGLVDGPYEHTKWARRKYAHAVLMRVAGLQRH